MMATARSGDPAAADFGDDGRDKDEFLFDFISNPIYLGLDANAISAKLTCR